MGQEPDAQLTNRIAEYLGEDLSRKSLEAEPAYLALFDALMDCVGLKDERRKATVAQPTKARRKNEELPERYRDDDYYFVRYFGITPAKLNGDVFTESLKEFDSLLEIYRNWRAIGNPSENKKFTRRQAEIFICCSAHAHGKTLKRHLAEFFNQYDGYRLRCLDGEGMRSARNKLIAQELGSAKSPNQINRPHNVDLGLELPPVLEGNNNYYGNKLIDIIGREKEWAILERFLACDKPFSWFQLAGVAGQGKSRLALELVIKARELGWNAGLINPLEIKRINDGEQWDVWQPGKPHLIVVDYVVSQLDTAAPFFLALSKRTTPYQYHVRFLLIEREPWNRGFTREGPTRTFQSADFLESRAHWFRGLLASHRYDASDSTVLGKRFETGVLELKKLTPDELLIIVKNVIRRVSSVRTILSDKQIKERLNRIDKDGRPLYAYFLAQQIASGFNTSGWTRDDLLNATLAREQDKWWAAAFNGGQGPALGKDDMASCLAVLAAMTGKVDCVELYSRGMIDRRPEDDERWQALVLSGASLSKDINGPSNIIPAIQPDLLAEWFVIKSFEGGLPLSKLIAIAWNYPEAVSGFLQRLFQDFFDHKIVKAILGSDSLIEVEVNILSKYVSYMVKGFNSRNKFVSDKIIAALRIAEKQGDLIAINTLAWFHYHGIGVVKDQIKAFELYAKAELMGSIDALKNLGICYQNGIGVSKDEKKAFGLYLKAEEAGDVPVKNNIGFCYQHGIGTEKDEKKAFDLYLEAAESGDTSAKNKLGDYYHCGIGTDKDENKAFVLYQEAGRAGHIGAIKNLANCYQHGIGTEKDEKKAFGLYLEAAESGDTSAKIKLGDYYHYGIGTDKDENKAFVLYQEAAQAGHIDAKKALIYYYVMGVGITRDGKNAVGMIREVMRTGDTQAIGMLAACYQFGDGVDKDEKKAHKLFRKAARAKDPASIVMLAVHYQYGVDGIVNKNERKAFRLYQEAAQMTISYAMEKLGNCYKYGIGTAQNLTEAEKWFQKAAEAKKM